MQIRGISGGLELSLSVISPFLILKHTLMKNLPIGIQSISEIYRRNGIYVDKTKYVCQLLTQRKYVFLSRPRRFGKSLLVSTPEVFILVLAISAGLAFYEIGRIKQWDEIKTKKAKINNLI